MPTQTAPALHPSALLRRIGLASPVVPSGRSLAAIQRHFVLSVPFENLDMHMSRPIRLELSHLFDKVVRQRRGGFCYELNGLLHWLLNSLGFSASLIAGRTFVNARLGDPFDHAAILVQLEETWLVDGGFGGFSRTPLRLQTLEPQYDGHEFFRIVSDAKCFTAAIEHDGQWNPRYQFSTEPRALQDFIPRCEYQESNPRSLFLRQQICTLALPNGRKTVAGDRFTETRDGHTQTNTIDPSRRLSTLATHFQINL